ncbi:hypothetical protein PENTCL1PPCAC_3504 [Pristionchus entomophagus]|uniref:Autophagy-related protein 13 n=1 Tax=Pristionchus entomophagus TaxID=358040 RepID=A0AAV5SIT3_9BILA|nr:hypothetical protein PENTCL1PPCAC_3504 [Pristionchus entomophagus]
MIIGSPPMRQSPLASPTSPSDYTVSALGRRASTASMRSEGTVVDDNDVYAFVKPYAKKFCNLMVQALVQSRQNEKYDTKGDSSSNSRAWFNLEQDEIGEISVHMKKTVTNYPPLISSFSVDFILYTADGDTLPLETWCLTYEPTPNPFQSSSSGRVSPSTVADTKSKFYKDLGIMLKSIIVAARMTPMHRYYVKKQGAETFVIIYRVLEGRSTIDLGAECKKKDLGSVPAPYGNFYLQLAYRTKMEIDRAATPASNDSFQGVHISPGTSPMVAGTPSSFCDVLSQFSASPGSQMASSPQYSRSRAVSEATSEPGMPMMREKRTSGSSGKGLEEPFSKSKEDDKTLIEKKENADSDDEEMNQSKLESPEMKKIPFANLLISSYTGILLTNGLSPPERERVEAACTTSMRVEKERSESVYRSRCDSAVIPEEESRSDGSEENSGGSEGSSEEERTIKGKESSEESEDEPAYSGLSDELSNSILQASTRTATDLSMSATLTVKTKREEEDEEEDENVMTATLRDDDTILRRSLLNLPVSGDEKEGEGKRGGESGSEKSEGGGSDDEEEDSFVRIAPLFSTNSSSQPGEDLSELITQLKGSPEIEGNTGYGIDHLNDIGQNELSMFSSLQGDFDRLVAQVKEAVEEDERREREGAYSTSVVQKMTTA